MSFKKRMLCIFSTLLLVAACAKENEPEELIEINFKGEKTQCLSDISATFERFFKGVIAEQELQEFWGCTRDAIQFFIDLTKGRTNTSAYSSGEIKDFLERFFVGGKTISPKLMAEILQLKRLLVGGGSTSVTRDEFLALKEILSELESITLVLRPEMSLVWTALTEPNTVEVSVEQVKKAEETIRQSTKRIGQILSRRQTAYTFNNLNSLFREIGKAFGGPENEGLGGATQYFPLLAEMKNLLVDKVNPQVVPHEEWGRLFEVASEVIGYFLRYRLFIEGQDWRQGQGFEQLHYVITSAEALIRRAVSERRDPYYDVAELVSLAQSLRSVNLIPEQFNEAATGDLIKVAVNRLLAFGSEAKEVDRLGIAHLNELRSEYWRWHSAQVYLQSLGSLSSPSPLAPNDPAVLEMQKVLDGPWQLKHDAHGRLLFDFSTGFNLIEGSRLNLERAIMRLVIRGFAEDPERKLTVSGLYEEEIKQIAVELYSVGEAFGLFKDGDTSLVDGIYFEGNLFMPRANGDEFLNFEESIEYLSFVLSGMAASNLIYDNLKRECPTIEDQGETKISVDCFRAKVSQNKILYLGHMPHLLKYLNQGTGDLWAEVEINLERALRDFDLTVPISQSEILKMWVLLQYVETFFGRFDVDRNSTVNLDESLLSFEVFQGPLNDLMGGFFENDSDDLMFFTFAMKYGETPFNSKWGGELKFLNWKWHTSRWSYDAHRLRVIKILAALNQLR